MTAESLSMKRTYADATAERREASPWRTLYRTGAAAALALIACTAIQAAVFIAWPPPSFDPTAGAVKDWFAMLQGSPLIGLLNLDLVMLIDYPLSLLVFLALYVALHRSNPSLTTIAAALGFMAITTYFAANPAFAMLSLAQQYGAAVTDAERGMIVAAGQTVLAIFKGSAFNTSYVLIAVSGLLMTAAMLRSRIFGKGTAWVGIAFYGMGLVPANAGTLGLVLSLASLVPMVVFLILAARGLLRLAREERQ